MNEQNRLYVPGAELVWSGTINETESELYLSSVMPDPKFCTAAGCVAIRDLATEEVVLTYNAGKSTERNGTWEILSGHRDPLDPNDPDSPKESPLRTTIREAMEEGGFRIVRSGLFAFRAMYNPPEAVQQARGGKIYPPVAYMEYRWAITGEPLRTPTEPDTACGTFNLDTVKVFTQLGIMSETEANITYFGMKAGQKAVLAA